MKELSILFIFLFSPVCGSLFACSCIGESTVAGGIKSADALLVGIILSKEQFLVTDSAVVPADPANRYTFADGRIIIRYAVLIQDSYKGKITADTAYVYTGRGHGDCGVGFDTGGRYIIYGDREPYLGSNSKLFPKSKNTFWTNICMRTVAYNEAEIAEIELHAKKHSRSSK